MQHMNMAGIFEAATLARHARDFLDGHLGDGDFERALEEARASAGSEALIIALACLGAASSSALDQLSGGAFLDSLSDAVIHEEFGS